MIADDLREQCFLGIPFVITVYAMNPEFKITQKLPKNMRAIIINRALIMLWILHKNNCFFNMCFECLVP